MFGFCKLLHFIGKQAKAQVPCNVYFTVVIKLTAMFYVLKPATSYHFLKGQAIDIFDQLDQSCTSPGGRWWAPSTKKK